MGFLRQKLLTRKEESNKLKLCPDCNGIAKVQIQRGYRNCLYRKVYDYVFIQCVDCCLSTKSVVLENDSDLENAIKESIRIWNIRG